MKNLGFLFAFFIGLNCFAEGTATAKAAATVTGASGIFMVVHGKVFVENAKHEVNQVKIKSMVYPGDLVWSEEDGSAKVVMSDRNVINILPGTKLKIEKYTNEPGDKNVDLRLNEGRIRLDVKEKYDGNSSKFQILSTVAVVGIRGTELVVSHKSDGNVTNVTVISGQVAVDRIGTLRDVMGFGIKGQVNVKAQQNVEVKKGVSGNTTELKSKEFEALKKETDIADEAPTNSNSGLNK